MEIPVEFESNGDKIRGVFYATEEQLPAPAVVFLGGFPPAEGDPQLARVLAQHGFHTLTFAFRGTLKSEGTFSGINALEDIDAALNYLQTEDVLRQLEVDGEQIVLGGVSFGGGMALAYAAGHPEIRRIFSLAGDDYGDFAREYTRDPDFAARIDGVMEALKASPEIIRFGNQGLMEELVQNADRFDLQLNAPALADRDILLIGGWDDSNVKIEDRIIPVYRALKEAGAQKVQLVAFQDDHSFAKHGDEIVDLLVHWLGASQPA